MIGMEDTLHSIVPGMVPEEAEKNIPTQILSLDDIFDDDFIPPITKSAEIISPPPIFSIAPCGPQRNSHSKLIDLDEIFDEFNFSASDSRSNALPVRSSGDTASGMNAEKKSAQNIENNFKYNEGDEDSDDDGDDDLDEEGRSRKKSRGMPSNMTEEQKVERRERNREHAKRSRVRKKFLLESLQQSVHALQEENDKLKLAIKDNLPEDADELLKSCTDGGPSVIATDPGDATKTLDDPDYSLVKALQTAQQNFVISDPSMPDNPIVYASTGFLNLSGYSLDQVLGRNCRFLQGPETDPRSVDRIRRGIEKGDDTTVVLLNYRMDGSTFWNQFFVAALRDGDGVIVNYLGVQCKVSEDYAKAFGTNETYEDSKK